MHPERSPWVDDGNAAILTDLYQLTMLQAYWRQGMDREATFSLFFRHLPRARNYLVACGLDEALRYLERLRFTGDSLDYLKTLDIFSRAFVDWLADFRFTGAVYAVPEGTPVFPDEPILEVVAPLPEAQLIETFVMNQIHHQTVIASKGARVVTAAAGRAVVDFGLRRMHGTDAGVKAARALHVAGAVATSNVLAGKIYGLPVTGTMAHSYVQAHDDEMSAFRAFAEIYPETVLLVDTYDTLAGIDKVVALAKELGESFRVRAIRLDSGALGDLAVAARHRLDEAGLQGVEIFASGGLDEHEISRLVAAGAPIDGFGVGTDMGVSCDAPVFDIVYKMSTYAGGGRLKLSAGKSTLPGRKQIFRVEEDGLAIGDVLARDREELPGRPLLRPVMAGGERLPAGRVELAASRDRARREIAKLPDRVRALEPCTPPYPVTVSRELADYRQAVIDGLTGRAC
ncbi:MAG: nicotinate phosphoribosyltransferase [Thermoanaerobaculia bacterium]